ncbi:MAG TPA: secretin N-terminal domain-containing protein [Pirellulales bacterium]|jgi:hypothetical protein
MSRKLRSIGPLALAAAAALGWQTTLFADDPLPTNPATPAPAMTPVPAVAPATPVAVPVPSTVGPAVPYPTAPSMRPIPSAAPGIKIDKPSTFQSDDQSKGNKLQVFSLEHAEATAMANLLSQIAPTLAKSKSGLAIAADGRTNLIIVTGKDEDVAAIEALIQRLDVAAPKQQANIVNFERFSGGNPAAPAFGGQVSGSAGDGSKPAPRRAAVAAGSGGSQQGGGMISGSSAGGGGFGRSSWTGGGGSSSGSSTGGGGFAGMVNGGSLVTSSESSDALEKRFRDADAAYKQAEEQFQKMTELLKQADDGLRSAENPSAAEKIHQQYLKFFEAQRAAADGLRRASEEQRRAVEQQRRAVEARTLSQNAFGPQHMGQANSFTWSAGPPSESQQKIDQLVQQYQAIKADPVDKGGADLKRIDALKDELRKALDKQFDERQKSEKSEIEQLRKRLDQLEKEMSQRSENRQSWVDKRLDGLLAASPASTAVSGTITLSPSGVSTLTSSGNGVITIKSDAIEMNAPGETTPSSTEPSEHSETRTFHLVPPTPVPDSVPSDGPSSR